MWAQDQKAWNLSIKFLSFVLCILMTYYYVITIKIFGHDHHFTFKKLCILNVGLIFPSFCSINGFHCVRGAKILVDRCMSSQYKQKGATHFKTQNKKLFIWKFQVYKTKGDLI